jgi:hypothetical protein
LDSCVCAKKACVHPEPAGSRGRIIEMDRVDPVPEDVDTHAVAALS